MSAKKPAAKAKEKTSKCGDSAGSTKRKSSRESAQVMDARSHKDRRQGQGNRREKDVPIEVERRSTERRTKVNRRRQIDPTTCERDYSIEEVEFMSAMDDYKRRSGRMFPTCSEVLEVLRSLGYEKRSELPTVAVPAAPVSLSRVTTEQAV